MSTVGPILVTGAAGRVGGVGGAVVTALRRRGLPVRALVRREDQRAVAQAGDDLPIGWLHRSDRYAEKLATPDTSVGDLIGALDR